MTCLINFYLIEGLILLKIQNRTDIKEMQLQWFIRFLVKKTGGGTVKNEIMQNKELAQELHKLIIRKFEKRKIHLFFIDNFWGADLADMQLLSKFNKQIRFLLCVIDIYGKYA